MAGWQITRQVHRMRRDWERRARENARHYVVTGQPKWTDDEFFQSGELVMNEEILNDLPNICQGKDPKQVRLLEVGCGAGRMTRAFARFFGEVYAVDISAEMVRQARRAVADLPNAHVFRNNGKDLSCLRRRWWRRDGIPEKSDLDFAFSFMVFQHIPSREIIENYVREVHKVLRPGGLFKFQVQGCAELEHAPLDSWVGAPFTEREAQEMADRCGFELRYQYGAGDQYYWLWYFKK
ncbi:MAG TPA: class I SAM-dependent methyltransferase [Bryobacteraceae bacterium]|jgi:SAM-dependent methyltransferase